MAQHIASEKARAHWRDILDAVAAGEEIVIERYGRPVAVLAPYSEEENPTTSRRVREPAPAYDVTAREQLKAEIVADVLAKLEAAQMESISWREGIAELSRSMSDSPFAKMTTEEIVEVMRQTRREIFEAEYAHLYR